jgi:hypothetical protein
MGTPPAAAMASTTSRVWKAMASMVARARWAAVVPRVIPRRVPLASGSHHGEPRPVNAGTSTAPPLSSTERASVSISAASAMTPRPSRSHCTAAPVTKMAPSRA